MSRKLCPGLSRSVGPFTFPKKAVRLDHLELEDTLICLPRRLRFSGYPCVSRTQVFSLLDRNIYKKGIYWIILKNKSIFMILKKNNIPPKQLAQRS